MFPTSLAVVFTVVFAATGTYAFARYVRLSAPGGGPSGAARAVELLHLLMSVAMIAMAWGWSGGPATGSGIVQLAVFGLFTVLFVVLATRARALAPAVSCGAHALMGAAMVWMVAAMPVLMGHAAGDGATAGGHAGHSGHGAAGAMDGMSTGPAAAAPAPTWALVLNGLLAALLVVAAIRWTARAARIVSAPVAAGTAVAGDTGPGADERGGGAVATLAPAVEAAPPATRRARVLAASCHTVMSLGMAAMLLAMT